MLHSAKLEEAAPERISSSAAMHGSLQVHTLTDANEAEVLAFLSARSVDTIYMAGLIHDNGLESPFNRGTFYAARDAEGQLQGVALIGHATLVEARTEEALATFAHLAKEHLNAHVIMGEQEKIERFWDYYQDGGQSPRRICRELCFEQRWPIQTYEPVPGLRQATLEDLPQIMLVNAQMVYEECGTNPLEADPQGFRLRLARRIEQGRVWVWTENGRMIFKADVMSESPEVIYLEGVHVHPDERGKGYGVRCMAQLCHALLMQTKAIWLIVNELNKDAQVFFFKAGFKLRGCYDTIFLQSQGH